MFLFGEHEDDAFSHDPQIFINYWILIENGSKKKNLTYGEGDSSRDARVIAS
jgi:hypothetical protein